ncbi:phage tail tape measure protein [Curtobacterium sp. NPDC098951]|uniref:phage tail tape measure protein n=1 Tax=Curtobacterium sp. NPDC098951 TaxID=3363974 RepID=UPI0038118BA8
MADRVVQVTVRAAIDNYVKGMEKVRKATADTAKESDKLEKVGQATQIAAVAMKQFNLEGKDVPHIADELAAGAGKALGGVEQLGDALNQSGLVASNFGFSLEETLGVLSAFADAGLLGSDSGTSLKTMLQQLANPSKESAQLMKSLGINVEDANGKFLGAADIAQVLHDKLSTLSDAQRQQALAQIFGSDAVRAATVLYKEGAGGIQGYIDQNNDAGYAMEQARLKSDNLNGDLEKLRSAFQTGLIDTGTSASSALRPLVQTLTGVVQAVNLLPDPLKATALGATGVVGAVSLLGGGMLFAIPKIVEFRSALATLRDGGITARSSLAGVAKFMTGPWGIALGTAAAVAAVFAAQQLQSAQYTQTLRDSLNQTTGALTKNTGELVANALAARSTIFGQEIEGSSAFDKAKRLGIGLDTVAKAAQGNTKAYKELLAVRKEIRGTDDNDFITKKYGEGLSDASGDITELVQAVEKQRAAVKNSKEQFGQLAEAQAGSADSSDDAAAGLDGVTDSAEDATQAIADVANAIKGFNSAQLDVNSTQRDLEAAIDGVTDSIEQNGQSLDVMTEKGRANSAALDSIAQSTLNYAGALYQQTGEQD